MSDVSSANEVEVTSNTKEVSASEAKVVDVKVPDVEAKISENGSSKLKENGDHAEPSKPGSSQSPTKADM